MRATATLVAIALFGERAAGQDYSVCSNDPSDAALTANDADPPAECATASCSAGAYFNMDWDGDESGCLDSYQECCWPCEDNTFQAVDSTQATFCEQCVGALGATDGAWISPPQWVSSACGDSATPASLTVQTGLTACATPSATQYASAPCVPGTPQAPGQDTELSDCSAPTATQLTTIPCFPGSVAECTANFPITAVTGSGTNNAALASLDDCVHAFDGATRAPQDTVVEDCVALTPAGTYVSEACVNGAHDTVGVQAVVSDCKEPAAVVAAMLPTQWVSTICDPGTPTVAGADTVIGACTMPTDTGYRTGTYVIEACKPGSSTNQGADTVLGDCDDAATQNDGCPINNLECEEKCEVGTGTWIFLFILLFLAVGGAVFAFLYHTEHANVMGGECRRGIAFEATTAPDKFITATDSNPESINLTTGLRLAAVDWMGKIGTRGDKVALFVECNAGASYQTAAMASGRGYRLCNNTLCLAPGGQVKLSEKAAIEADRCARLKSGDGLLPDELKGGLDGPVGRGIQLVWTTDMDKGLEFMLEGALNKDVEASSITCRLMADDGSSEDKYYLRHDEAKLVLQRDTHADDNAASWFVRNPEHVAVLMGKTAAVDDEDEEDGLVKQQNPMDFANPVAEAGHDDGME